VPLVALLARPPQLDPVVLVAWFTDLRCLCSCL
jgi:hypothetical protein